MAVQDNNKVPPRGLLPKRNTRPISQYEGKDNNPNNMSNNENIAFDDQAENTNNPFEEEDTEKEQPKVVAKARQGLQHFAKKKFGRLLTTDSRQDFLVCAGFFCDVLAMSLPVILVPMAATEYGIVLGHTSTQVASQIARVFSVASVGGALGTFINGFVCQELGIYRSSQWYLKAMGMSSILFSISTTPTTLGLSYACMEFFSTIQSPALALILLQYYQGRPAKLAAALTALGLTGTAGEILAKILGSALTGVLNWRQVSQIGAAISLVGAFCISQAPGRQDAQQKLKQQKQQQPFRLSSITDSIRAVLGKSIFWKLSFLYSMSFMSCCGDRIVGPFYMEVTSLPPNICGGLTVTIILGAIIGLLSGTKHIARMTDNIKAQQSFFSKRQIGNVISTMGLAGLSYFSSSIPNKILMAGMIAVLSSFMSATVSYQYYHFPAAIGNLFGDEHAAVCLSFLDGLGYLLSVPIFEALGEVVPRFGWGPAWLMLSGLFGAAGFIGMKSLLPVLQQGVDSEGEEHKTQ